MGFGEAVAELEHLGPLVGTEMHPERAVAAFEREGRRLLHLLPPLGTLNGVQQ